MNVQEKIKSLIKKIKKYFSHETCYEEMEKQGIAVFGMCKGVTGGDVYTNYLNYSCIDCPNCGARMDGKGEDNATD